MPLERDEISRSSFLLGMIFSDLAELVIGPATSGRTRWPAETLNVRTTSRLGFAQAGNRLPLFGIMPLIDRSIP
jgi:hypothetical protein